MKTLREMAAERKADRTAEALKLAKEAERVRVAERRKKVRLEEGMVTIGKVTYSIKALETSLERAKQKKQKEYDSAIAAGRSKSCANAVSNYYSSNVINRLTTMLACAHSRNEP